MRWIRIGQKNNGALSCGKHSDYNAFKKWADSVGVTQYGFIGGHSDIPGLIRGYHILSEINVDNPPCGRRTDWLDHGRIYRGNGQRYLVSHIYNKSPENISALEKWCAGNAFSISYLEKDWYYPDIALGVVITTTTPWDRPDEAYYG